MIVQLMGLYESTLNSVLVTEYLAGGDLVTRFVTRKNLCHRVPCWGRPFHKVSSKENSLYQSTCHKISNKEKLLSQSVGKPCHMVDN